MLLPGGPIKSLADKNKPTEGDAQAVEQAFRARLEALGIGNKDPSVAAAHQPSGFGGA
jgi:hypothetical protein